VPIVPVVVLEAMVAIPEDDKSYEHPLKQEFHFYLCNFLEHFNKLLSFKQQGKLAIGFK
jgi:hypothetical protein